MIMKLRRFLGLADQVDVSELLPTSGELQEARRKREAAERVRQAHDELAEQHAREEAVIRAAAIDETVALVREFLRKAPEAGLSRSGGGYRVVDQGHGCTLKVDRTGWTHFYSGGMDTYSLRRLRRHSAWPDLADTDAWASLFSRLLLGKEEQAT
jgi:hypothetical protein